MGRTASLEEDVREGESDVNRMEDDNGKDNKIISTKLERRAGRRPALMYNDGVHPSRYLKGCNLQGDSEERGGMIEEE